MTFLAGKHNMFGYGLPAQNVQGQAQRLKRHKIRRERRTCISQVLNSFFRRLTFDRLNSFVLLKGSFSLMTFDPNQAFPQGICDKELRIL